MNYDGNWKAGTQMLEIGLEIWI